MNRSVTRIGAAMLLVAVVFTNEGCCYKPECVKTVAVTPRKAPPPVVEQPAPVDPCGPSTSELPALPPNAKPNECYAKVYVPPTYKTVTEKVRIREASERVEVVPAEYEWVEERVLAKEASTELRVVPAEYAERDQTIETASARTDWEIKKASNCVDHANQPAVDVYCLVQRPAEKKVVKEQYVAKPASIQTEVIPAEYQTIKRQRLARPATTRRVAIPAEYAEVTRTIKVCDARIAWQRVPCEETGAASAELSETVQEETRTANLNP